ncbi:hypothetical protein AAKU55_002567 [Oxalobacteraceae bacterium GrIS 1.11]
MARQRACLSQLPSLPFYSGATSMDQQFEDGLRIRKQVMGEMEMIPA